MMIIIIIKNQIKYKSSNATTVTPYIEALTNLDKVLADANIYVIKSLFNQKDINYVEPIFTQLNQIINGILNSISTLRYEIYTKIVEVEKTMLNITSKIGSLCLSSNKLLKKKALGNCAVKINPALTYTIIITP